GKNAWVEKRRLEKQWKDVVAYDASDLEQWVEQSIPGQAWFANETQRPSRGVRTLERYWMEWASVAEPTLSEELFASAVIGSRDTILRYVSKPPNGPLTIAADSAGEAVAFIAQAFGVAGGNELAQYRDKVLLLEKPGVLPEISEGVKGAVV